MLGFTEKGVVGLEFYSRPTGKSRGIYRVDSRITGTTFEGHQLQGSKIVKRISWKKIITSSSNLYIWPAQIWKKNLIHMLILRVWSPSVYKASQFPYQGSRIDSVTSLKTGINPLIILKGKIMILFNCLGNDQVNGWITIRLRKGLDQMYIQFNVWIMISGSRPKSRSESW